MQKKKQQQWRWQHQQQWASFDTGCFFQLCHLFTVQQVPAEKAWPAMHEWVTPQPQVYTHPRLSSLHSNVHRCSTHTHKLLSIYTHNNPMHAHSPSYGSTKWETNTAAHTECHTPSHTQGPVKKHRNLNGSLCMLLSLLCLNYNIKFTEHKATGLHFIFTTVFNPTE